MTWLTLSIRTLSINIEIVNFELINNFFGRFKIEDGSLM